MKMSKKLLAGITATLIMTASLSATSLTADAYVKETYTKEWTTGVLNKTYYKEQFQQYSDLYTATLRYMSTSLYWNKSTSSQSLSIAQNRTVAAQTSMSLAQSLGMSVQVDGIGVSTNASYTTTFSYTTSYSDVQTYTATLTSTDKVGYYTWEARINFYKWKTDMWKRANKRQSWNYLGYGWQTTYQTQNPYFYCAYTSFAVN